MGSLLDLPDYLYQLEPDRSLPPDPWLEQRWAIELAQYLSHKGRLVG